MNNNQGKMRCNNCGRTMGNSDRYCKYCGTQAGEGEYVPSLAGYAEVYGPPPRRRTHKCKKCGYSWDTFSMIDNQRFCPKCGEAAPYEECDEDW